MASLKGRKIFPSYLKTFYLYFSGSTPNQQTGTLGALRAVGSELKQTLCAGDDDRCFNAARRIPRENNHKRDAPVGDHPLI